MSCPLPLLSSPLLHLSQADHPRMATSKPLVEQILQAPASAFLRSGLQPGTTQLRTQGAAPKLQNLIYKQTLTNQGSTPSRRLQDPDLLARCQRDVSWRHPQGTATVSQLLVSAERSVLMKDAIAEPASGQTNVISCICRKQTLARTGGGWEHIPL